MYGTGDSSGLFLFLLLLLGAEAVHPPLSEASRPPVTAKAVAHARESNRKTRAKEGKPEARFQDMDLWPIVVAQNFVGEGARERLMSYARRCGGQAMVRFLFTNWDKLPSLIDRCWAVDSAAGIFVSRPHRPSVPGERGGRASIDGAHAG